MTRNEKIAAAIRRLSSEHGLPNRFAVSEIARECGLSNLNAGKALAGSLLSIQAYVGKPLAHELDDPITYIAVE